MRKLLSVFVLSFLFICIATVVTAEKQSDEIEDAFLRLHIRADSNEKRAQEVKLKVRDVVLKNVDALLKNAKDRDTAERIVSENLDSIVNTTNQVLKNEGESYRSNAKVGKTYFPTRDYGEYALPAGEYDALILELGSGKGDNWWCVLYPSLCKGTLRIADTALTNEGVTILSSGKKVNVRFKIIELWNGLKEKFS